MKTAVIAGASGLVGKQLLYTLLESDLYTRVIAVVRKKMPIKHDKLMQRVVDYDRLADYRFELLGEEYFCCLGTTIKQAGSQEEFYKVDFTYCVEFAKIAKINDADRFLLVSAVGADAKSTVFYSKVKGKAERAIAKLGFPHFQVFRPSLLVGSRTEPRLSEQVGIGIAKAISPLMVGRLIQYKPIEAAQVANAMFNAAQQNATKKVKTYTFADMVAI